MTVPNSIKIHCPSAAAIISLSNLTTSCCIISLPPPRTAITAILHPYFITYTYCYYHSCLCIVLSPPITPCLLTIPSYCLALCLCDKVSDLHYACGVSAWAVQRGRQQMVLKCVHVCVHLCMPWNNKREVEAEKLGQSLPTTNCFSRSLSCSRIGSHWLFSKSRDWSGSSKGAWWHSFTIANIVFYDMCFTMSRSTQSRTTSTTAVLGSESTQSRKLTIAVLGSRNPGCTQSRRPTIPTTAVVNSWNPEPYGQCPCHIAN